MDSMNKNNFKWLVIDDDNKVIDSGVGTVKVLENGVTYNDYGESVTVPSGFVIRIERNTFLVYGYLSCNNYCQSTFIFKFYKYNCGINKRQ